MDWDTILAGPVEAIFARLADPARLGDWLPGITGPPTRPAHPAGAGTAFPITVRADQGHLAGSGEMTAFEPPWLAGYRLFIGPRTALLRITCAACPGGTRVHLHQAGDAALDIDLTQLTRTWPAPRQGETT